MNDGRVAVFYECGCADVVDESYYLAGLCYCRICGADVVEVRR